MYGFLHATQTIRTIHLVHCIWYTPDITNSKLLHSCRNFPISLHCHHRFLPLPFMAMKEHSTALRQSIDSYMERHQMSGRRFGEAALSDPGFLAALNRGRSLRIDTADRLFVFMGKEPIGPGFRREIEEFLKITRIQPYLLGLCAVQDPSFVQRLRKGTSPRLATIDRVRQWMNNVSTEDEKRAFNNTTKEPTQ